MTKAAAARVDDLSAVSEIQEEVRRLERLLSRKTMEVDILREMLAVARAKEAEAGFPHDGRRCERDAISRRSSIARRVVP